MPLKTLVKVGRITNLSDARYCAGMGVDMLGFTVLEGQEAYISPKLFQELRGWVAGPRVVAEVYGLTNASQITSIIENYAPEFIELSFAEYRKLPASITLPLLVSITEEDIQAAATLNDQRIAYWIMDADAQQVRQVPGPVLLKTSSKDGLADKLKHHGIKGVALSGSPEIRPGYKNYDELADVLEWLDE